MKTPAIISPGSEYRKAAPRVACLPSLMIIVDIGLRCPSRTLCVRLDALWRAFRCRCVLQLLRGAGRSLTQKALIIR